MLNNSNKNILLCITGSIAAYKAIEIARLLIKNGATVKVVMTTSALEFITTLSFSSVTKNQVYTSSFSKETNWDTKHIELAKWADIVLIAPATANIIAKINHGIADDLLSTICLATPAPIFIAPAMNKEMWNNVATKDNVNSLLKKGIKFIGPDTGVQLCGDIGYGRMLEPQKIIDGIINAQVKPLLTNKKVIITAGPTVEPIDPIRFLSNNSSGKMGYAIASAAKQYGAETTLISGPTNLIAPLGVKTIMVKTAVQMLDAVMQEINDNGCDIFIATAAVADYRVTDSNNHKIKKNKEQEITLKLTQNPDILHSVATLANRPLTIGFAAETENLISNAEKKLIDKNLDVIAANIVGDNIGFNSEENALTLIAKNGKTLQLSKQNKLSLAKELIHFISEQ